MGLCHVWDWVGIGKVKAQHNEQNADVIVASTATLARGRFMRDPSLINYDTANLSMARSVNFTTLFASIYRRYLR